jgi:hypothetical protein
MDKVENLKKITVTIQAGTEPDDMKLTPQTPQFSFIFGLGPEGMTPFEYELVDKTQNDEVQLHLQEASLTTFFEHLNPPIWDLMQDRDEIYLSVKIAGIENADNREVVKAMADMAGHGGGGCDCGCGCG